MGRPRHLAAAGRRSVLGMPAAIGTLAAMVLLIGPGTGSASAQGSGFFVTLAARSCNSYTSIFANRALNDIQESLRDLGPNSPYAAGQQISPIIEAMPPQDTCVPIPGWQFTLGRGIQERADADPSWGALSRVTSPFPRGPITTLAQTPLLDTSGNPIGTQQLAGAVTFELTPAERTQSTSGSQLWIQGGVPGDPVLVQHFPGPEFGFGALQFARLVGIIEDERLTTSTATTSSTSPSPRACATSSASRCTSSHRLRAGRSRSRSR